MKVKIMLFFFTITLISCIEKSANDLFESFVQKESNEKYLVLKTADLNPTESLDGNYLKIIENHGNTNYLLEKAESIKETKYCIPNLVCPMTEGDIAVCMLIDMYQMSDNYFETVMYENIKRKTDSAKDFWDYIHASENNRKEIIRKITEWIMIYKSSDLLLPWTEDEIINHRFELISDTKIETFVFHQTDDEIQIVDCIYDKKDSFVTGPIEYWCIENGLLCIYQDENMLFKKRIIIGKIRIDEEKEILYAYRNNKKIEYKYTKNKST
ncbi:hypothetical protein E4O03_04595 [Treponema sp. OMZ 792]|uniref:hypothetical protein n=1 Tax=unclassified Treponema TaxID=2638727 RepID=UPI0020A462E9|nr:MULTISPECIES: hypothetical protein [unclassified Treponema]UTC75991.1 hypothetical protein E4O03_04595 [Treponema sp. OMZ 792]UTC79993.1 hypothetical protein E4O07_04615 [Treponema sp. OMZ 798]